MNKVTLFLCRLQCASRVCCGAATTTTTNTAELCQPFSLSFFCSWSHGWSLKEDKDGKTTRAPLQLCFYKLLTHFKRCSFFNAMQLQLFFVARFRASVFLASQFGQELRCHYDWNWAKLKYRESKLMNETTEFWKTIQISLKGFCALTRRLSRKTRFYADLRLRGVKLFDGNGCILQSHFVEIWK